MRIALFDDHQVVLDSLTAYLRGKPAVEIAGTATTSTALLHLLRNQEVDILICDVLTEEATGLELFEKIHALNLPLKVVAFSSITSPIIQDYLKSYGVAAFVNKRESLDLLWETIEMLMLTPDRKASSAPGEKPPTLTPREKEVAKYVAKGLSAKEIALLLGSSVNTVNNQRTALMLKFGCSNSVELALKLAQMGYLPL